MDMTIKSPVQIFINDKFFCIANEVEVKHNDNRFKKHLIPDNIKVDTSQFTGTVINIKKPPRTKEENKEVKKESKDKDYDAFFQKMVNAVDNPNAHTPVDWEDNNAKKEYP